MEPHPLGGFVRKRFKPRDQFNGGADDEPPTFRDEIDACEQPFAYPVNDPEPVVSFKTAAAFVGEYVPLSYTIEPMLRSASLYTLTARTGAGKTAFNVVAALAVATGRADILGREVHKGRVAYLACENPDDIRMRIQIAAFMQACRVHNGQMDRHFKGQKGR